MIAKMKNIQHKHRSVKRVGEEMGGAKSPFGHSFRSMIGKMGIFQHNPAM